MNVGLLILQLELLKKNEIRKTRIHSVMRHCVAQRHKGSAVVLLGTIFIEEIQQQRIFLTNVNHLILAFRYSGRRPRSSCV